MKMKVDWERMYKESRKACDRLEQELAELKASLLKVRADAVREAAETLCFFRGLVNTVGPDELNEHADKLEAGNE